MNGPCRLRRRPVSFLTSRREVSIAVSGCGGVETLGRHRIRAFVAAGLRINAFLEGNEWGTAGLVPALRKFAADGEYLVTLGGRGHGPGEYANSDGGLVVFTDGRVVLRDPGNGRFTVYGRDGEHVWATEPAELDVRYLVRYRIELEASFQGALDGFRFEFVAEELRRADGWAVERGFARAHVHGEGMNIPRRKYVLLYEQDDNGCCRIAWSITNTDAGPS